MLAIGGLNLRASAGSAAARVGQLRANAAVTVLEGPVQADGYDWYRVDNGAGVVGWVAAGPQADPWLRFEEQGGQAAVAPAATQTPAAQPTTAPAESAAAQPTPAPAESTSAGGQEYIVQRGDSLYALAKRFYGNGERWRLIFDATNARASTDSTFQVIAKPQLIRPGQKLVIPAP